MARRHPLPRLWLMTDERIGEALWTALARLPRGAGVVFRHHHTPAAERRRLLRQVAQVARRRGLVLVVAGRRHGVRAGAHGHAARRRGPELLTRPVHSRTDLVSAARAGADAVFVSPVFPTRSHPGARALGRVRLGLLVRGRGTAVIALGGMDARRARSLAPLGITRWAAIDAWLA